MKRFLFAVFAIMVGLAAGLVFTGRLHSSLSSDAAALARPRPTGARPARPPQAAAPRALLAGLPDFTGVAGQAVGAVTNISSSRSVRRPNTPFVNDPFFRYFFGEEPEMFGWREQRDVRSARAWSCRATATS